MLGLFRRLSCGWPLKRLVRALRTPRVPHHLHALPEVHRFWQFSGTEQVTLQTKVFTQLCTRYLLSPRWREKWRILRASRTRIRNGLGINELWLSNTAPRLVSVPNASSPRQRTLRLPVALNSIAPCVRYLHHRTRHSSSHISRAA